ncbi:MAG: alpha-N-arabinofuranosidase, partial [Brachybacterium tyrofermentans]
MTARARTLTPGLVSALSPTATGSPAAGATGSTGPSSTPTGGPARVVVDLDLPGSTISRHLYGHFAEHLGRC